MTQQYGLIFNNGHDIIYLGLYNEGSISEFNEISDFDGLYTNFPLHKFAFVSVNIDEYENLHILDINNFEIAKQGEGVPIETNITVFLEEIEFPSASANEVLLELFEAGVEAYKTSLN